jgi:hypothetical protein
LPETNLTVLPETNTTVLPEILPETEEIMTNTSECVIKKLQYNINTDSTNYSFGCTNIEE